MATYKQKTKQYIINAAKQPTYIHRGEYILFNLNSCFVKKNNMVRFQSVLDEAVSKGGSKINLCNLASLCYKIDMPYTSKETYEFVASLIELIKEKYDLQLTQDEIESFGEIDMRPIDTLVSFDKNADVIYTNEVLIKCLNILGYADCQLTKIVDYTQNLKTIIPIDLIEELPIMNRKTWKAYKKIAGLLC